MKKIIVTLWLALLTVSVPVWAAPTWGTQKICNDMDFPILVFAAFNVGDYWEHSPGIYRDDGFHWEAHGRYPIASKTCGEVPLQNDEIIGTNNTRVRYREGYYGAESEDRGLGWVWYKPGSIQFYKNSTIVERQDACIFRNVPFSINVIGNPFISNYYSTCADLGKRENTRLGVDVGATLVSMTLLDGSDTYHFTASNAYKKGTNPIQKEAVIFVNGVFNTDAGVASGQAETKRLYDLFQSQRPNDPAKPTQGEVISVRNNLNLYFGDLIETFWQKAREQESLPARQKSIYVRYMKAIALLQIGGDAIGMPGSVMEDTLKTLAAKWANAQSTDDLNVMVAEVRKQLKDRRRVLLVGHSQGTLFANAVYLALTVEERKSVGILAIAEMGIQVASGDPYVTVYNDLAANGLRFIYNVARGTTENSTVYQASSEDQPLHHAFVATYGKGNVTQKTILSYMGTILDRLVTPP